MRPTVTVIGDALLDVHVAPSERLRHGADVRAAISVACGGQGANVAVRLARRDVDVSLVCAMAEDAAGALLRAELALAGVRLHAVPVEATGTVVVLRDDAGERTMMSQRMPFAARAADALPAAADWVIVSGYLLLEPSLESLAVALSGSRLVLVGCAVPPDRAAHWAAAAARLRPPLTVLNRDEAQALGAERRDGIVLTDATGVEAWLAGSHVRSTVPAGPPAIDTTGAGDAFTAGLVAGLVESGWPPTDLELRSALESGVALASAVARLAGAQAPVEAEGFGTHPR